MLRNPLYSYGDEHGLQYPADLNLGGHLLRKFMQYKDNIAIIDAATDKRLTYGELAQLTVDIALSLVRIGVRKGDVVGISSAVKSDYLPTMVGIMCVGAAYAIIDVSDQATILHRTQLVKPKVSFCTQEAYKINIDTLGSVSSIEKFILYGDEHQEGATLFKDFLTEHCDVDNFVAAPVYGWADICAIWYSSGTTGIPKAVPMTHLNVLAKISIILCESNCIGKRVITAVEFCTADLSCLEAGLTIVQYSTDKALNILEAIQKYEVKIIIQVPFVIFDIVNSPDLENYDVSFVEYILSRAAALTIYLLKTIQMRLPNVRDCCQSYGCTEVGPLCSDEGLLTRKPGSVGRVLPASIMKIVDVTTNMPLGANQRGEIRIKSPRVFKGYVGEGPCSLLDEEGFYCTGDLGYYDDDRYFYVVDRIQDLIKYHGHSVAPAELEAVLLQRPAVYEAAVVGAPDEKYGELPTAFVVLRPGAKAFGEELIAYVNGQVADWMPLAGGVRFVAKLPRGRRHKVDKKTLRRML